jgi:hypothetical protein
MSVEATARLARYARDELQDSLRSVAIIYDDDFEVQYLREDLRDTYTRETYGDIVDVFREIPTADWDGPGDGPIGERNSVVHCHENAFIFQFNISGCHSVLMSVDPDVGTKLRTFIGDCQNRF